MPTPKQTRYHYKRIRKAHNALTVALNEAHDARVLVYDSQEYKDESPCATNWQTEERIKATTEKALAQAMREEIMDHK